jgi:superfamily II DNA helicase RecQ
MPPQGGRDFLKRRYFMQIRIFTVPSADSGALQAEMNAFLAGHRALEIEQKFFQNDNGGYWSFCVRYINGGAAPAQGYPGKKTDYREILNEKDFSVFSKLRAIRKELAAADGSPAYVVFTDEELANIARLPEITEKAMLAVQGIGDKKVAKYGKAMIDRYAAQTPPPAAAENTAAGESPK